MSGSKKTLYFATGNEGKLAAARTMIPGFDIQPLDIELREIQSNAFVEVAKDKVLQGFKKTGKPVFCDDAGIILDEYGIFPGVYTKDMWSQLGKQGFQKLMHNTQNTRGSLRAVIAYMDENLDEPVAFEGIDEGSWDFEQPLDPAYASLPFDAFFYPDEFNQTGEKKFRVVDKWELWESGISHRARAMKLFYDFLLKQE